MHKKLFIAVLALALLLATTPVFASDSPIEVPVKVYGNGLSKAAFTPTPEVSADPLVTVNGGQNRTVPGTFCDGWWQGAYTYSVGGWYAGNEFYAAYQDPSDPARWNGTCSNSPSFDVTATNAVFRFSAGPFPATFAFQPLVFGVSSTAECAIAPAPVAGGIQCSGPLYSLTFGAAATYLFNMPFPVECCVSGPFFAGYYAPTAGALRLGCDGGYASPMGATCGVFNDYGTGWDELSKYFTWPSPGPYNLEHIVFAEGYTPDDPATHCTPGTCSYEFWYTCSSPTSTCATDGEARRFVDGNDDWSTYFPIPSGSHSGRTKAGVRFQAVGADTLKEIQILRYNPGAPGADDLLIEVWLGDGPPSPECGLPTPGTLVYSTVVTGVTTVYPMMTVVPLPDLVFGTLNGGPTVDFFVTCGVAAGDGTGFPAGDPVTTTGCLPAPDESHSVLFFPNYDGTLGPKWLYTSERNYYSGTPGGNFEFVWDALICREVLPAIESNCASAGPDEWSQFAHDARQTSASSINVGDPNQVTLSWTQPLPRVTNFTNPTIANDIVYISSDQEVRAYNLNTGAFIAQLQGAPEMGSSNRGNTTVAYVNALGRDVVFATGGSFNAISALETNLEASPTIWSKNPGNTPLIHQNRFNTSKVVDIAGTSVLFVCTEPAAGNGAIYAFDAATGALYPGWATNPVILDAAAKHGPAVNGGKLYVGTAIGGSNVAGSLYQIDAATGTIDWNFVGIPGEGWPSGVSTEGNFVYGATKDANNLGYRYKIDVSGAVPSVVWTNTQGVGLYGTPTIGRGFVYFPLDNPSYGLLQVSKDLGLVARNFAAENICGVSVYMIPQTVTLSCDAFLFAGDRNGRWWLFNAMTGLPEWYREFPFITGGEIVNGTSLATSSLGDSYAVVGIRQLFGLGGRVSAYKLNAGPRPRLIQCKTDETVVVPLGAGPGNPYSVSDVFMNIGDMPLNITALNIVDPLPDGMASARRDAINFRTAINSATAGYDGYTNYLTTGFTKAQRLAGLTADKVDGEFMTSEVAAMASNESLLSTRNDARSMAAGAAMIRTSNVLVGGAPVPTTIAPAGSAGLDWTFDGTGLGRGADANDIELTMNDPDFNFDGSPVATFHILYQGGCVFAEDTLTFNNDGSYETVFNHGALGDDGGDEWLFAADATGPGADLFDGTLIVAGDSVAGGTAPDYGAQIFMDMFGNQERFVPNVAPTSGACGFDNVTNVVLGAYRDGGCPGTPVDIHGEKVIASYSDTNFAATPGTPGAAIGLDIVMTEVGAYDPLYGDFKLIRWEMTNRDAVAKGPIHAGTFCDWDVNAGTDNMGIVSDVFNGYAIWSRPVGTIAYGWLNPNMPSTYAGVDPTFDSPHKIWILSNPNDVYDPAPWDMGSDSKLQTVWSQLVHGGPREIHNPATNEDKSGLLVNKPFSLGPNGSAAIHQAVFGVDASSNDPLVIEANAADVAKRAARWAGFARGDVNDDGVVDLADVCWLQGGNFIYPAAYSGDVNNDGLNDGADIAKLLSYVSGNAADRPVGAWRF
ncbi:MAG TPA: PQQ-binding-like beta-propeller repeat protein [bacterium]|nr:PQQ-binding-like beta-propeller repeat protein [bacterium]